MIGNSFGKKTQLILMLFCLVSFKVLAHSVSEKAIIDFIYVPDVIKNWKNSYFEKVERLKNTLVVTTIPLPTVRETNIPVTFLKNTPAGILKSKSLISISGGKNKRFPIFKTRWKIIFPISSYNLLLSWKINKVMVP